MTRAVLLQIKADAEARIIAGDTDPVWVEQRRAALEALRRMG